MLQTFQATNKQKKLRSLCLSSTLSYIYSYISSFQISSHYKKIVKWLRSSMCNGTFELRYKKYMKLLCYIVIKDIMVREIGLVGLNLRLIKRLRIIVCRVNIFIWSHQTGHQFRNYSSSVMTTENKYFLAIKIYIYIYIYIKREKSCNNSLSHEILCLLWIFGKCWLIFSLFESGLN